MSKTTSRSSSGACSCARTSTTGRASGAFATSPPIFTSISSPLPVISVPQHDRHGVQDQQHGQQHHDGSRRERTEPLVGKRRPPEDDDRQRREAIPDAL